MRMLRRHEIRSVANVVAGAIVTALLAACQVPQQPTPAAPTVTPLSQPFITIVPDRIPPGGQISIVGADWQAGEEIRLGLVSTVPTTGTGSILLAVVPADAQGQFQFLTTVPTQTMPGVWQVYAQTRTPGRFATGTLTVLQPTSTPPPTLTPAPTFTTVPTRVPTRRPPPPPRQPTPTIAPVIPTAVPTTIILPPFPDWRGEYYSNPNLAGAPVIIRNDAVIDFNWGYSSPDSRIPPDNFSARWTRSWQFEPGTYRFTLRADDGVRMFVDNILVLDDWRDGAARDVTTDITLAGRPYSFRIEYYERFGFASIRLDVFRLPPFTPTPSPTSLPTSTNTPTPIPTPTPVIIPPTATPIPMPTQIPPQATATRTPIPIPPTATFTTVPLPTATTTKTSTPVPISTATPTLTATSVPVNTATATTTSLPTASATSIPTTSPTTAPTSTSTSVPPPATATATSTPTQEPTATSLPTASSTPTELPTETPTLEPSNTPTSESPTETPTLEPSNTPTSESPTETPTLEPTATSTDEATPTPTATATQPVSPTQTVTATLTLSDLTLTVRGTRWTPRELVTIGLSDNPDGTDAVPLGTVRVNNQGRFRFDDTLEQAPSGPVYAIVEDEEGTKVVALVRQRP